MKKISFKIKVSKNSIPIDSTFSLYGSSLPHWNPNIPNLHLTLSIYSTEGSLVSIANSFSSLTTSYPFPPFHGLFVLSVSCLTYLFCAISGSSFPLFVSFDPQYRRCSIFYLLTGCSVLKFLFLMKWVCWNFGFW